MLEDEEVVIQAALVGFTAPDALPQSSAASPFRGLKLSEGFSRDPYFSLRELIAEAYEREGYKEVLLTPHSADKGRDVIVSATLPGIGTVKIADQAKR